MPDDLPQGQLQRNVHLFLVVIDFRKNPYGIGNPVPADEVDPQSYLILGQHLLPGDFHLQQPGIRQLYVDPRAVVPKIVGALIQQLDQLLIDKQQRLLIGSHLHLADQFQGNPVTDIAGNILSHLRLPHIRQPELMLIIDVPESVAAADQAAGIFTIYVVQRRHLIGNICHRQLLFQLRVPGKYG